MQGLKKKKKSKRDQELYYIRECCWLRGKEEEKNLSESIVCSGMSGSPSNRLNQELLQMQPWTFPLLERTWSRTSPAAQRACSADAPLPVPLGLGASTVIPAGLKQTGKQNEAGSVPLKCVRSALSGFLSLHLYFFFSAHWG